VAATVPVPKFARELLLAPPYPLSTKAWDGGGTAAVLGLRVDMSRKEKGRRVGGREGWSQLLQRLVSDVASNISMVRSGMFRRESIFGETLNEPEPSAKL